MNRRRDGLHRRLDSITQTDTHLIKLQGLTPQEMINRYRSKMPQERKQAISTEKQERDARRRQAATIFLKRRERELNELNASDTQ